MALPISKLPQEILREVRTHKWIAFFLFAFISFAVLAAGFLWPYKYESQVIILVDDTNIIGELMQGSAVTTKINERASVARETLWKREVMERLARDEDLYGEGAAEADDGVINGRVAELRSGFDVRPRGESYFTIIYSAESPLRAFRTAQRLGQVFIEESSGRKRAESRAAYDFIDKQVKSYESQLAEVEGDLKQFLSDNDDGTEGAANSRMANLRSQLELAQMEKAELQSRAQSLEDQLNGVSPSFSQGGPNAYEKRIQSMQEQLDTLRLQYHDTYPDIVILKEQLAELRKQRDAAMANGETAAESEGGGTANPLYQELRGALVNTNADIETINTRIQSIEQLMASQSERMERIQANKAQYSDLTRDMEVNKQIYDDLLKRRERARVSMHLDIEGQGLNYRISESAQFPSEPSGLQFPMFAAAGILLGLVAPFGAFGGLLQIDPRVRARQQLEGDIGLPVLVELPRVRTPFEKRRERRLTVAVLVCAAIAAVVYIAIAVSASLGVI
ncbi:XrtA system polysaccharide chain length determinant [Marinobacter salicampi]|uniref:XrtA system polysaccharide chain length determinant n=1 Tax=Marinobacter salicampi TaxID=435907 RepID=UPI0014089990|nr:XrtA system polysaccharide chain length determinant [Marinobacter salicampi]